MAASVRDDDPLVPPERVEGIGVLTSHLRHTGLGSERDILNGVHRLLGGKDWRNETGWVDPDERGTRNPWKNQFLVRRAHPVILSSTTTDSTTPLVIGTAAAM